MTGAIRYISTRNGAAPHTFTDAMLSGLAPDGGLYVPEILPTLPDEQIKHLFSSHNFGILGATLLDDFIAELSKATLTTCIQDSINFPIPLIHLEENIFLLEVFHGPTLAFKDVGARFMAKTLLHLLRGKNKTIDILVATSGDTGSAVAHGFYGIPGIRVHVLYPADRITPLQERQMTTLGGNILPLKVLGNFDDCQRLVKTALHDATLSAATGLFFSTANSINIARLLPQMIYHASGITQLKEKFGAENPLLCIPSGNLGNLVSAIYAKARGMPIRHFIAATNRNTVFPDFLTHGQITERSSIQTCSSAMDVGHPSNLERLRRFFHDDIQKMRAAITALSINDDQTLETIRSIYKTHHYITDPHTAVGIAAARTFCSRRTEFQKHPIIVTATAHPAKFPDVIQKALGEMAPTVPALLALMQRPITSRTLPPDDATFRNLLLADARLDFS